MGSACYMTTDAQRPRRALVLRRADLQWLQAEVAAGACRSPEEAAEQRKWTEHLDRLKEGSRLLAEQKESGSQITEGERLAAAKEARATAAREERERQVEEATRGREAQRAQLLQRCNDMLAANNIGGRRALDSALLFAETLRERQAQLAFDEQLRAAERRYEQQWEERIRQDLQRQAQLECLQKEAADERKRAFREALVKQLEDNAAVRTDEKNRMAQERQKLDAIQKELALAIASEKTGAAERKEAWRKAVEESLEDSRRAQRNRYALALEEERVAKAFGDMQHKINVTAKRKQRERIEDFMKERRKCGSKIWEAYDKFVKGLEEEEKRRQQAQKEEEQRWEERKQMEEARRKCIVAYRQQGHQEYREGVMKHNRDAVSDAHFYAELRERQEDETRRLEEQRLERERQKRLQTRGNLCKQMAERKEQEKREQDIDKQFLDITKCLWADEDGQFFKYADELIKDSKAKGRVLLPLERAIHEYKKKNSLLPRTTRTNTVKTPTKC